MGRIKRKSNSSCAKINMIGKYSEIGAQTALLLKEKMDAERAKSAVTPEERAWRRYNSPEEGARIAQAAMKAALASAGYEP